MYPSLAAYIGHRVALSMKEGRPWFGVRLVGELREPPPKSPDGSVMLAHKTGGDVILLPGFISGVREAKASER